MTEPRPEASRRWSAGRFGLYALHWGLIINMAVQVFYASYMVFVVMRPKGVEGPLWSAAQRLVIEQPDLMHARRAYATEAWVAIVGLSLYLAVTEIGPRLRKYRA